MESDRRRHLNLDLKAERCRKQAIPIFARNIRLPVTYANSTFSVDWIADANWTALVLVAWLAIAPFVWFFSYYYANELLIFWFLFACLSSNYGFCYLSYANETLIRLIPRLGMQMSPLQPG